MAVERTPIHRNPLQEVAHFFHETGVAIVRHPLHVALTGGLASLGAAGYLLFSRGGPTPPQEQTKASDTLKQPFEGGGPENPNVVISPGFQGQEPSPTPKPPEVNSVDQAIKNGVIKAETPQDFLTYFAAMSKEQIAAEIAEARKEGEVKVLNPVKKKGLGGLSIKEFQSKGLTTNPDAPLRTYMGINGVEGSIDEVVASISGSAKITHGVITGLGRVVYIHLKNDFTEMNIFYNDIGAQDLIPEGQTDVEVGTSLLRSTNPVPFAEGPFAGAEMVVSVKNISWDTTSVSELVQEPQTGKIATAG